MIEYHRMMRTMRRRAFLSLLFIVVVIGIWQSPPIPIDRLLRSVTPDSAMAYYKYQGVAQTLSSDIKTTQRRLDWYLERAELLGAAQDPEPLLKQNSAKSTELIKILEVSQRQETIQKAIREGEQLLKENQPRQAIDHLHEARKDLYRIIDALLAIPHFIEAQRAMSRLETSLAESSDTGESAADFREANEATAEYLEQGNIEHAAYILTRFLGEQQK